MKKSILCSSAALLSSFCLSANAQQKKNTDLPKNAVYAEFLGNGFLGSVNYERIFLARPRLAARVGIGVYGLKDVSPTVNAGLHYLLPVHKQNLFVDFGAGAAYSQNDGRAYVIVDYRPERTPPNHTVSFVPSVGFRAHTNNNWLFRASLTAFVNPIGFIPSVGISVGRIF